MGFPYSVFFASIHRGWEAELSAYEIGAKRNKKKEMKRLGYVKARKDADCYRTMTQCFPIHTSLFFNRGNGSGGGGGDRGTPSRVSKTWRAMRVERMMVEREKAAVKNEKSLSARNDMTSS